MRPLSIYLVGISMYIYDSFPDDFGQFRRFFFNGNGQTDGWTDPLIEMRGRI